MATIKLPKGLCENGLVPFTGSGGGKIDFLVVEKVRGWLRQSGVRKTKHFNRDFGSYSWKHDAQHALGIYVSPGAMIAAFILEGFEYGEVHDANCLIKCTSLGKQYRNEIRRQIPMYERKQLTA
jgi:hypothetical protein